MKDNIPSSANYEDYEIDLGVLLNSLNQSKKFIFIFTLIIGLLATLYTISLPDITPTYKSRIFFLAPSELNVKKLNKMIQTSETRKSLYNKFLTKSMSVDFQKKIFNKNNYALFLNNSNSSVDFDHFGDEFISSIKTLDSEILAVSKVGSYEVPWNISMTGKDPILVSNFLNDLAKNANIEVMNELEKIAELEIKSRLNAISIEKLQLSKSDTSLESIKTRIINLNVEEEILLSKKIDFTDLNSVHIDKLAEPALLPETHKERRRSVILLFQIIGGFLLSIFIVYIRNIYYFGKKDNLFKY
jgi:LPS O-antigen subunit length determinant protein (WzzB/FepE family)